MSKERPIVRGWRENDSILKTITAPLDSNLREGHTITYRGRDKRLRLYRIVAARLIEMEDGYPATELECEEIPLRLGGSRPTWSRTQ